MQVTVTTNHSYLNIDAVEGFSIDKVPLVFPWWPFDFDVRTIHCNNDIRESCDKK